MTEPEFLRATRASYDAVAEGYARRFGAELAAKPLDRAMLAGFAELVRSAGNRPVADVGCRTGRMTAPPGHPGTGGLRDRPVTGDGRGDAAITPRAALRHRLHAGP